MQCFLLFGHYYWNLDILLFKRQVFGKRLVIYASNDLIYVVVVLLVGYDAEFKGPLILGRYKVVSENKILGK